ncbi:C39 family peptidase [Nocardioides sp.]|uniref:C39 family peptidase n=1 Tax=Nocardioides sp. TaxID=35761 RepID=UPI0027249A0E|nr:C39 family peptidase [Nocardioides sp.]MDO9455133.1 C39 family peptidase [Nocardioides sp.]
MTTGTAETDVATTATPVAAQARRIDYHQWDSTAELAAGRSYGVTVANGRAAFTTSAARRKVGRTTYETAKWESGWVSPGFAFTQLVPSWSAVTPADSFVEVRVRGRNAAGTLSSWDLMGRWALWDTYTKRTTDSGQADDLASVDVDTWKAAAGLTSWQVRVVLGRRAGTTVRPSFDTVGAVASSLPTTAPATSAPGVARGVVLDVPRYSQMVHRGHFPQWGNGGEAWCSPTSTSMVLGYYEKLPRAASYNWVPSGHTDPWVDYAARMTYDHDYDGTGNWPFNTAYAAPLAGKAFVTRLRDLREAERFIKAGIPLVASVTFGSGELDGAPISSTAGHLLVIAGFTDDGDVVVNDPAASTRAGVRRTYDRGQFERAWLPRSGGLVYVIRDAAHPLPKRSPGNW